MTDRQQQINRPRLAGETKSFSVGSNPKSYVKTYFEQVGSKALADPFAKHYLSENSWKIIKPPVNPYALIKIIQENSHLLQCIDAMVTNVHGFGYRMEFIGKDEDETTPAAMQELQWLEELFDGPNPIYSFQELRERLGFDLWSVGNAYMEVGRDNENHVMTLHHVPAPTMRITRMEAEAVPVVEILHRFGKKLKIKTKRQFRKFVQLDEQGKRVYFKEFGDPRTIDP